jgi:hypothetical protein
MCGPLVKIAAFFYLLYRGCCVCGAFLACFLEDKLMTRSSFVLKELVYFIYIITLRTASVKALRLKGEG